MNPGKSFANILKKQDTETKQKNKTYDIEEIKNQI
jgi:hypothetical protein